MAPAQWNVRRMRAEAHKLSRNSWRNSPRGAIEVRMLSSRCQWGTIRPEKRPAGIIFMNFTYYSSAINSSSTIEISLGELQNQNDDEGDSFSTLQLTDHFGPRLLQAQSKATGTARRTSFRPEVSVLRYSMDSLSAGAERPTETWTKPWTLQGFAVTNVNDSQVRSLKWRVEVNDVHESQLWRKRVILIGFALEHTGRPFSLDVKVQSDVSGAKWLAEMLNVSSDRSSISRSIVIDPTSMSNTSQSLDELAFALPTQMEQENMVDVITKLRNPFAAPVHSEDSDSAKLESFLKKGRNPLSWAAGVGNVDEVRNLLSCAPEMDTPEYGVGTPLNWAARQGHLEVVRVFIEHYEKKGEMNAELFTRP